MFGCWPLTSSVAVMIASSSRIAGSPACCVRKRTSSSAARGSPCGYSAWPKPGRSSPRCSRVSMKSRGDAASRASAMRASVISAKARAVAPPWRGPDSAARPAQTVACRGAPVEATTRAANAETLSSWSAHSTSAARTKSAKPASPGFQTSASSAWTGPVGGGRPTSSAAFWRSRVAAISWRARGVEFSVPRVPSASSGIAAIARSSGGSAASAAIAATWAGHASSAAANGSWSPQSQSRRAASSNVAPSRTAAMAERPR